ncbi:hypothetical protein QAD02_010789 [Eretmocerus hayati]|uniref:Uncharacterized protein n=1 Tax=Eretmocerus hayati TaxID=131215 RepID=A0ACC2NVW8_9HYME|nr:hypothetical protein QAD02_010789 [Eretmocerus hayati]
MEGSSSSKVAGAPSDSKYITSEIDLLLVHLNQITIDLKQSRINSSSSCIHGLDIKTEPVTEQEILLINKTQYLLKRLMSSIEKYANRCKNINSNMKNRQETASRLCRTLKEMLRRSRSCIVQKKSLALSSSVSPGPTEEIDRALLDEEENLQFALEDNLEQCEEGILRCESVFGKVMILEEEIELMTWKLTDLEKCVVEVERNETNLDHVVRELVEIAQLVPENDREFQRLIELCKVETDQVTDLLNSTYPCLVQHFQRLSDQVDSR